MMIALILFSVAVLFYLLCLQPLNYWKRLGVPQYNCWTTLIQTILGLIPIKPISEFVGSVYSDFSEKRYVGVYFFQKPLLVIRDPELIKQITVKDFDHFVDHVQIVPENCEPLWERNLFALKGDKWKDMRATLSPSFTSSKMKMIFQLMSEYARKFVEYYEEQPGPIHLEMKDTFTRFTNDVIATTAFGINCDSIRNPNNEFYVMGKQLTSMDRLEIKIKSALLQLSPKIFYKLGFRFFEKKLSEFFSGLVLESVKLREQTGLVRPDMIHLLMEARKNRTNDVLTDEDIVAQALIFFFAGFESVSTQMCFVAHELAINVDVQKRLQEEVDATLEACDGTVTYDALTKMKYLDMVISETLRKWPTAFVLDRLCVKPYTIEPTRDGETPVHLKKGDFLWIPVYGFHRDEKIYPEPERYDPERFDENNKGRLNPYEYLPFGVGPRMCIGNRFALMEMKLALFYILSKFTITVIDKTNVPLKVGKSAFQLTSEGGFWLGLSPRGSNKNY